LKKSEHVEFDKLHWLSGPHVGHFYHMLVELWQINPLAIKQVTKFSVLLLLSKQHNYVASFVLNDLLLHTAIGGWIMNSSIFLGSGFDFDFLSTLGICWEVVILMCNRVKAPTTLRRLLFRKDFVIGCIARLVFCSFSQTIICQMFFLVDRRS
jgi:hypothetical protein